MQQNKLFLIVDAILISTIVGLVWGYHYSASIGSVLPIDYGRDALFGLARIKAYASGEIFPFLPNHVGSLNAPFDANWSDFPAADMVYLPAAILTVFVGLAYGTSLYILLLQIAAGLTFYAASRVIGYKRDVVVAGAILFALAPYAFYRGLHHLTLTVYWHLPLLLLAVVWCADPDRLLLSTKRGLLAFSCVAVLAGVFSPYYLFCFIWLAGLILIGQLANRRLINARNTAILIGVAILAFVSQHIDTLLFVATEGKNQAAVSRGLAGLDVWGLRLSDLIFPSVHRSGFIQEISQSIYRSHIPGFLRAEEIQSAYLGVFSILGLAWLLISGTINISAKRFEKISIWYWIAIAIIALGIVGGVNYLFGAFGFVLFRATNRFSIILMAAALFFLCEIFSRKWSSGYSWLFFAIVISIGIWDQVPPKTPTSIAVQLRDIFQSDKDMVSQLEEQLPKQAMVFQLPVKGYPETGPIHHMADYEHFRPYLHSISLRFSYGTIKGRGDAEWQTEVASSTVAEMLAKLERYGFSALMINRKGYPDGGNAISKEMRELKYKSIVDRGDFIVFRLHPSDSPVLPEIVPIHLAYGPGFYGIEQSGAEKWIWGREHANLLLLRAYLPKNYQQTNKEKKVTLGFDIAPLQPTNVWMEIGSGNKKQVLSDKQGRNHVEASIPLTKREIIISFTSDRPAQPPGNEDPRLLAFRIINPQVKIDGVQ